MDFWREIPPPNVSLAIIAKAHGAKFDGAPSAPRSVPQQMQETDPHVLVAALGLQGVGTYQPPRRGLAIATPEGNA